jgi:hypothetical protein
VQEAGQDWREKVSSSKIQGSREQWLGTLDTFGLGRQAFFLQSRIGLPLAVGIREQSLGKLFDQSHIGLPLVVVI